MIETKLKLMLMSRLSSPAHMLMLASLVRTGLKRNLHDDSLAKFSSLVVQIAFASSFVSDSQRKSCSQ